MADEDEFTIDWGDGHPVRATRYQVVTIPTLGDYAELIEWLHDRHDSSPMPEHLKPILDDAIRRMRLRRQARAMERDFYESSLAGYDRIARWRLE